MDDALARLDRLVRNGVPADALAFYGRWWQLETWLREAVYLELRGRFGREWELHLGERAPGRAERDEINAYMASADAGDVLAYLDVFDLFSLIDEHWELFEPVLLPRARWDGLVDALRPLRNRIAHCRRPHPDDVDRIEQLLRDLERGARCFYGAYVGKRRADAYADDPVVRGWVAGEHSVAKRLLGHADRQYDVRFRLECTVRPWGELPVSQTLTGTPGAIWHARWSLGTDEVEPAELWTRLAGYRNVRELLVHVLLSSPWEAEITFAAVDDPTAALSTDFVPAWRSSPMRLMQPSVWAFESLQPVLEAIRRAHESLPPGSLGSKAAIRFFEKREELPPWRRFTDRLSWMGLTWAMLVEHAIPERELVRMGRLRDRSLRHLLIALEIAAEVVPVDVPRWRKWYKEVRRLEPGLPRASILWDRFRKHGIPMQKLVAAAAYGREALEAEVAHLPSEVLEVRPRELSMRSPAARARPGLR